MWLFLVDEIGAVVGGGITIDNMEEDGVPSTVY